MIAAAFLFLYVVVQLVICINSMLMNARDGLCTDENVSFLAFLDASGNAARSNFIPSIVLTTVTSSLPFVLFYVVPLLEISIRRDMKPILRDGATSWALLMVVELLKYLIREPRPSAYYTCISSHESWGMPSGHSTWTVGLWVYAVLREDSWLHQTHGNLIRPAGLLWALCIPLTRYELQYHTWQQILVGATLGSVIGFLMSKFYVSRLIAARFQFFILWLIISCAFTNSFSPLKHLIPLLIEISIAIGSFYTIKRNLYHLVNESEDNFEFGIKEEAKSAEKSKKNNLAYV